MTELAALLSKKAELDKEIEATIQSGRAEAVARVKELMSQHGLKLEDLRTKIGPRKAGKVVAKYRDETGNTWSGRGLKPKWLQNAMATGKKIEEFAIA